MTGLLTSEVTDKTECLLRLVRLQGRVDLTSAAGCDGIRLMNDWKVDWFDRCRQEADVTRYFLSKFDYLRLKRQADCPILSCEFVPLLNYRTEVAGRGRIPCLPTTDGMEPTRVFRCTCSTEC